MKRHILGAGLAALVGAGTLVAAGCGASVNVGSLPLDQTFDECADGFSMNDAVSTVECTDGQLRILVSKPELSPMHNVPFRFDPSVEGLTVTWPVEKVALGDSFVVVVSSPDAPAGHAVPFKLCVNHGARPVCTVEHLGGGTDYATGWQVDPGEEVDGQLRLSVRVKGREVAATSAALGG